MKIGTYRPDRSIHQVNKTTAFIWFYTPDIRHPHLYENARPRNRMVLNLLSTMLSSS